MEKKALGRGLDALLPAVTRPVAEPDRGDVQELRLDAVVPNRYQPRQQFSEAELVELAQSLKQNGLLQPILVRRKGDGIFELVAGERRLRAARLAGFEKIPALIRNCTDQESMVLALVENLQRDDLNPMDTARAYHRMVNEFGLTQEAIAQQVGGDRSSIANMLRLMTLPIEIQEFVELDQLSMGHAKVILGLVTPDAQIQLARRLIKEQLSVREAERLVQHQPQARRGGKRSVRQPVRSDLEERLQKRLGTRVTVEKGRRGGKIIIHYFSPEELDGVTEKILNEERAF
ncbi:MAG TPA: ParB/RepB/Spo0J family partition protein [Nitrospiraceae bacterium]|jgi:ParB family transcriptional regulator, chromosome partitioning protein|nr:ParB/RepB/Spo0J family partition protein [Nitrospiraceae bacterium]